MTGAGTPHYNAHVTWTRRPAARVTVRSGMFRGAERRFAGGGNFGEAGAGGTLLESECEFSAIVKLVCEGGWCGDFPNEDQHTFTFVIHIQTQCFVIERSANFEFTILQASLFAKFIRIVRCKSHIGQLLTINFNFQKFHV